MTQGERLFSSILVHKDSASLFRIKKEWLDTADERAIYKWMKEYVRENQELPGLKSAIIKYPQVTTVSAKPSMYLKELHERHIYTTLLKETPGIIKGLKADPVARLNELRGIISNLYTPNKTKASPYHEDSEKRYDEYLQSILTGGITYLSSGDEVLDKTIYGYHRHDLTTIGGRAGSKKTWLLCVLSVLLEKVLPETEGPILFISNEIDDNDINKRFDCLNFKLGATRFLSGTLTPAEAGRYKKGVKILSAKKNSRIITLFNVDTLNDLEELIMIYDPSIVMLDGSYLLESQMEEGMNKTIFITRNLKGLSKSTGVPIINTTQLRKKSGKGKYANALDGQDEFYYGSYVQDSDFAIRMFTEPEMIWQNKIGMEFVKGRRIPPNSIIEWEFDLDKMFSKFHADISLVTKTVHESDEEIDF